MRALVHRLLPVFMFSCICSCASADTQPTRLVIPKGTVYTAPGENGGSRVKVIVFDANPAPGPASLPSAGFVLPIPVLQNGAPAEVRVYNLNSFLNTYDLSFCRQDFHTAGPPSGLGGLLVASRGLALRGASARPPLTDTTLHRDSVEFEFNFQKYQTATEPIRRCAALVAAAVNDPAATNSSIRYLATQAVWGLFPSDNLPQTSTIQSDTITSGLGVTVLVADYAPDQQTDLERLRRDLREYDTNTIAAAGASMKLWYDQWNKDYQSMPATGSLDIEATNDRIQNAEQTAAEFGSGGNTLGAVTAIYSAAIDQAATPPFAVKRVDSVTGADIEEAQISVNGKPPTGPYAQVNLDNSRIGVPGVTGQTYLADAHVYGRGVLDFSAGLVLTTLQNKNYYGEPTGAGSSTKTVRRGSSDGADILAGVLTTYYKTVESGLALGPSLGVSVGTNTRYLLGLSLVSTVHRSRLLLTVGGASGSVAELANGDAVGQVARTSTVSTSSVQRFGGFIALTWSLFSE